MAVAYASIKLGIPAKDLRAQDPITLENPENPDYRAELVITGDRYADALAASEIWA